MPTNPDLHADLAVIKPTRQISTTEGTYSRMRRDTTPPTGTAGPDSGRGLANKVRAKNTLTSGDMMTRGVSKESIVALNTSTDSGRALADAVRTINADNDQLPSKPAIETATKALQGQRDITQRAPNLNLKAQVALKGGGGEGESEKLNEMGSTQDEINKAKKATKGFSIVPEGF
jgi:hypothetical protein